MNLGDNAKTVRSRMIEEGIERRRDPRTQAYIPITLKMEGADEGTPAHLLDLSNSGAAVLTTAYDSPELGEYLDLIFDYPTKNEDGEPGVSRRETGLIVHIRTPERGVTRLGIRFLQHRSIGSDLFDPMQVLSGHRGTIVTKPTENRWAAGVENHDQPALALN